MWNFKDKKKWKKGIVTLLVCMTAIMALSSLRITPANKKSDEAQTTVADEKKSETKKKTTAKETAQNGEGEAEAEKETDEAASRGEDVAGEMSAANGQTEIPAAQDSTQNSAALTSDYPAPTPAEPQEDSTPAAPQEHPSAEKEEATIQCTVTIRCDAISGNGVLTANGHPMEEPYAANPEILAAKTYRMKEGESAYDILKKACSENGIALDSEYTKAYDSYYVKGIQYLYEFYAGYGSGWMYQVNGTVPAVGCSAYKLSDGDTVTWYYVTQ